VAAVLLVLMGDVERAATIGRLDHHLLLQLGALELRQRGGQIVDVHRSARLRR
jgi:hypothetical protein